MARLNAIADQYKRCIAGKKKSAEEAKLIPKIIVAPGTYVIHMII